MDHKDICNALDDTSYVRADYSRDASKGHVGGMLLRTSVLPTGAQHIREDRITAQKKRKMAYEHSSEEDMLGRIGEFNYMGDKEKRLQPHGTGD